jgi:molybdenum cofactor synthesis domain-containing protein
MTGDKLVTVAEARQLVLAQVAPLGPRRVVARDACGLVLAQSVLAGEAVPRFANSAMDGYALRAADVARAPARLRVTGNTAAGDEAGAALGHGEAVRIMTGAPVPPGADAVCPIEHVRVCDGGAAVVIDAALGPGTNVRQPGEDIAAGSEVFPAGTLLRAAHVGVLASLGVRSVLVRPRPAVGVLSTGNELARAGAAVPAGKIRDANRPALLAQVRADGFRPVDLGIGPDDQDALLELLLDAAGRCDAIVATGGVSVGDHDVLRTALEKAGGATARSLRIAVRPGKHVTIALAGERRVPAFGLPGNPVAALVGYELYTRPALRLMAGCLALDRPRIIAVAETDLRRKPGPSLYLVRVTVQAGPDGVARARSSGSQHSHMLRAMAHGNGLALLPDGDGIRAGERVEVLLLDPDALLPDGAMAIP